MVNNGPQSGAGQTKPDCPREFVSDPHSMAKGPAMNPFLQLTLARIRESLREPEALFWIFVFPVLLTLALGIAFRNQPVSKSRVAVEKDSPTATQLATRLSPSPHLEVSVLSAQTASAALRAGKQDLVVRPSSSSSSGPSKETSSDSALPEFIFIYDATRSEGRQARLVVEDALQRGLGRKDVAKIRDQNETAPGMRYIDFLIPALIGMNLMGSGMWGIGFNVVQSRSKKLLKRMAATPMRRSHFLLSFMLSRLLFLVPEVAALLGFGWLVFAIKIQGSMLALIVIVLLGSFAFAGLGLLVATRTASIEAVSGWINFVMMPMYILSGNFFSYTRFPKFFWPFIRLLPLTALNDALRAVINEGAPLFMSWRELIVISVWGALSFVLALKIFRWQ